MTVKRKCATIYLFCIIGVAAVQADDDDEPWFVAAESFDFPHPFALSLQETTFGSTIQSSTAEHIMIDFFAPWCPHCQYFAPHFERLALTIQRSSAPQSILAATVDCVRFSDLCNAWNITSYPTVLWGTRDAFLTRSGYEQIEATPRNTDVFAEWINNHSDAKLDTSIVTDDEFAALLTGDQQQHEFNNSQVVADASDMLLALALTIHNALSHHALNNDSLEVLVEFVERSADHLPDCRSSLLTLRDRLSADTGDFMTRDGEIRIINTSKLEETWQLCDKSWDEYRSGWRSCRGTWPGKRGYTCGLWMYLHSLAASFTDESAENGIASMRRMLWHFFDCADCRHHFFQIPVAKADVQTRRDAQLWLWNAHNNVNRRVKELEAVNQQGDPGFPKAQWPSQSMCAECKRINFLQRVGAQPEGKHMTGASFIQRRYKIMQKHIQVSPRLSRIGEPELQMPEIGDPPLEPIAGDEDAKILDLPSSVALEGWNTPAISQFLDSFYKDASSNVDGMR